MKINMTHYNLAKGSNLYKLKIRCNMSWLDKLKIKPHTKAEFGILLCRMVAMPIVDLALLVDI
jgi:hypothetical protein